MSCQHGPIAKAAKGGSMAPQSFVDQRPVYDNQVISRKGIIRPDKRKKKKRYL